MKREILNDKITVILSSRKGVKQYTFTKTARKILMYFFISNLLSFAGLGFYIKKLSDDLQHLATVNNINLEFKRLDDEKYKRIAKNNKYLKTAKLQHEVRTNEKNKK
jgi:hypothetical protein